MIAAILVAFSLFFGFGGPVEAAIADTVATPAPVEVVEESTYTYTPKALEIPTVKAVKPIEIAPPVKAEAAPEVQEVEAEEVQSLYADNGLLACEYEDSANCFWDAGESGNGLGYSFHDVDGVAYYSCEEEDTANCFWDASKRGDGAGRSFTDVNGVAIWWDEIS